MFFIPKPNDEKDIKELRMEKITTKKIERLFRKKYKKNNWKDVFYEKIIKNTALVLFNQGDLKCNTESKRALNNIGDKVAHFLEFKIKKEKGEIAVRVEYELITTNDKKEITDLEDYTFVLREKGEIRIFLEELKKQISDFTN